MSTRISGKTAIVDSEFGDVTVCLYLGTHISVSDGWIHRGGHDDDPGWIVAHSTERCPDVAESALVQGF